MEWVQQSSNRHIARYGLYEIHRYIWHAHPYCAYKQVSPNSTLSLGQYKTLDEAKADCETDLATMLDSHIKAIHQKDTDMSKDIPIQIGQLNVYHHPEDPDMSKDETIHTSPTGARKAGNLERHDLIPAGPLIQLARHYGIGAQKYDDNNWQKGYNWSLSYAALQRHITAFWQGQDIDEETGSPHTIAAAWHALALTWFMTNKPEYDDRPKNDSHH